MPQLEVLLLSAQVRFQTEPNFRRNVCWVTLLGIALMLLMMPIDAFAALPWESPICLIAQSLSGPVARSATVIAVVGTGLMLAFGEIGGPFLTGLRILFGLSLALAVSSWIPLMFPGAASSITGCLGGY